MKYITTYTYVDLETGEIEETNKVKEEEKRKIIRIIKTEKNIKYGTYSTRNTQITKYYRRNEYKQTKLY